jgi:diacylglycerol kinase
MQEALAQMGKSAKDTAALAKALGNAFKIFFWGIVQRCNLVGLWLGP